MSDRRKLAAPPGVGAGKPDNPFAVTVEDPVPVRPLQIYIEHTVDHINGGFFRWIRNKISRVPHNVNILFCILSFLRSHADMINVINSTEGVLYVRSNDDALVLACLY